MVNKNNLNGFVIDSISSITATRELKEEPQPPESMPKYDCTIANLLKLPIAAMTNASGEYVSPFNKYVIDMRGSMFPSSWKASAIQCDCSQEELEFMYSTCYSYKKKLWLDAYDKYIYEKSQWDKGIKKWEVFHFDLGEGVII